VAIDRLPHRYHAQFACRGDTGLNDKSVTLAEKAGVSRGTAVDGTLTTEMPAAGRAVG
jgi:hypothetical protein